MIAADGVQIITAIWHNKYAKFANQFVHTFSFSNQIFLAILGRKMFKM